LKELKVQVPMGLYLQMLRCKILEGQTISATLEQALRRYFDTLAARSLPPPLPPAPDSDPPA
jgi:hypothetical protein